jgi:hypothetical protein
LRVAGAENLLWKTKTINPAISWQVMMTKRKNFLTYGLRSAAGLVGAAIAAAVVAFLCIVPLPNFTANARSQLVTPTPTDQRLICPGSIVDVLTLDGDATSFGAVGVPEYVTSELETSITQTALSAPDASSGDTLTQPQQLFAPAPTTDSVPQISGAQSQQVITESISGLATAACGEASTDAWLVGGSTQTGRTTLVLLTNPTEVAANVAVTVLGENGWVSGPGSSGIIVEPASQRIISLAALAPNLANPVVRVTSTGGQVVPTLQQSVVRTLLPDGVELIAPGATPNVRLVIPGIRLSGMASQHASEGGVVTSDREPAIRVGVPGEQDAAVTVTAYGVSGKPVAVKSNIPAGRVVELPFGKLDDGVYTLVVSATQPVVAAARTINYADVEPFVAGTSANTAPNTPAPSGTSSPQGMGENSPSSTRPPRLTPPSEQQVTPASGAQTASLVHDLGDPELDVFLTAPGATPATDALGSTPPLVGGDFTWNVSTLPVLGETLVSVSSGPLPTLTLFNSSKNDMTIRLSEDDASLPDVTIPSFGVRAVPLKPGLRYVMSSEMAVYAAVNYAGKGRGASVPLTPASPLGSGIMVFPR